MSETDFVFMAQWRAVEGDTHPFNHWLTSMFEEIDPNVPLFGDARRVKEFNSLGAAEKAIKDCPLDFGEYRIVQVQTTYTEVIKIRAGK